MYERISGYGCNANGSLVVDMKLSPDHQRLVTGSADGAVRVWQVPTAQLLLEIPQAHPSATVTAVTFTPDGMRILSGGDDGLLRFWDAKTGSEQLMDEAGDVSSSLETGVQSIQYSPTGKLLVIAQDDATLFLADVKTGRRVRDLVNGHSGSMRCVAFGCGDELWASGAEDKTVCLWDGAGMKRLKKNLDAHDAMVSSLCFSGDGAWLASGDDDGVVLIWDLGEILKNSQSTMEWKPRLKIDTVVSGDEYAAVCSLLFAMDQNAIIAAQNGLVRLWDLEDAQWIRTLYSRPLSKAIKDQLEEDEEENVDTVTRLLRTPTHLISGGWASIRFWQYLSEDQQANTDLEDHNGNVNAMQFSPDGSELVTGCDDSFVRVFCASSGKERLRLAGHTDSVTHVSYSPDGERILSAGLGNTIRVWSAATGRGIVQIARQSGHRELPVCFDHAGKKIFATMVDNRIAMFDAFTGQLLGYFCGHNVNGAITQLAVSSNGVFLSAGDKNGCLWVWKIGETEQKSFFAMNKVVPRVNFAILWRINDKGEQEYSENRALDCTVANDSYSQLGTMRPGSITALVFSKDSKKLVSGHSNGLVCVWQTDTAATPEGFQLRHVIKEANYAIRSLNFLSPNQIYTVNEMSDYLEFHVNERDYKRGKAMQVSQTWDEIICCARSPTSDRLAVATGDNLVMLFDVASEKDLLRFQGAVTPIQYSVAPRPDSTDIFADNDWFQKKLASDPDFSLNNVFKVSTLFTGMPDDSECFGVWVKKASLFPGETDGVADEMLLRCSLKWCNVETFRAIVENLEDDQLEEFIYNAAENCLANDFVKLQVLFDYLVENADVANLTLFLQELDPLKKLDDCDSKDDLPEPWIPTLNSALKTNRNMVASFVSYFSNCLQVQRNLLTIADWKNFSAHVVDFFDCCPENVSAIIKQIGFYQAPCWKEEEPTLARIEDDVEFIDPIKSAKGGLSSHDAVLRSNLLESSYTEESEVKAFLDSRKPKKKLVQSKKAKLREEEPVMVCFIPIFRPNGRLFGAMANYEGEASLFSSIFIETLVDFKWKKFGHIGFRLWLVVYLIYLALFYASFYLANTSVNASIPRYTVYITGGFQMLIAIMFLFIEVNQLVITSARNYFSDPVNWVDLYAFVVPSVLTVNSIFQFMPLPANLIGPIHAITTLLLFLELFTLLEASSHMGHFILMFFKVMKAARPFVAFLLMFILCFWIAFESLSVASPQFSIFLTLYYVIVNQRSVDSVVAATNSVVPTASTFIEIGSAVLFVSFTFFIIIVSMNLLIAIVNNAYTDVTANLAGEVTRARMNAIWKLENLLRLAGQLDNRQFFPDWIFYLVRHDLFERKSPSEGKAFDGTPEEIMIQIETLFKALNKKKQA